MDKIPTAEEILSKYSKNYGVLGNNPRAIIKGTEALEAMVEFTKLHLQAQQEAIFEKHEYYHGSDRYGHDKYISKDSIASAYPLNNII